MSRMAERVKAARSYSSEQDQKQELLRAFHSWVSQNGFIQTDATKKSRKRCFTRCIEGSESVNELEATLKNKTLSEL